MADMAYQVFVDLDATALEGGSIYLGVANDDPEQNPIPVFWDQALTIAATQPLRTSGGVIVRDGTPSDVFANVAGYSIRVRNRAGKVVWYKPTTGGTSTSRLSFPIPSGPPGETGETGPAGPADNTYTSYAAMQASNPARKSARLVGDTDTPPHPDGPYNNPTQTIGGWVPQSAQGIAYGSATVDKALDAQSRKLEQTVYVTDPPYNAVGDGVADDSAAIRAAVDANKGGTIILPANRTFLAAGIILSGSTYNGTRLVVEGTLKLASNVDGTELGRMNFQTTWCAIVFHDCEGCSIDVPGMLDGNRANMTTTREQIIGLCLAGARKFKIDRFRAQEVRGDGIYVSISNFFAASTNSADGTFGPIEVINSADDGRNAVSVISGVRLTFSTITSTRVGGIVRGIRQPGGFDIEPDNGTLHKVDSVVVGMCNITTIGTTGVAVLGQPATSGGRDWNTTNVTISDFLVNHTGDAVTGGGPVFWGSRNLTARGKMIRTVARGGIMEIPYGDEMDLNLTIRNCGNGFTLGSPSAPLRDCNLVLNVNDWSNSAIHAIWTRGCTISGKITNASVTSAVGVRVSAGGTTVDTTKIAVSQLVGNNEHTGVVSGGGTIAATTYMGDCELVGFTSYAKQCTAQIASVNVKGRNDAATIPTDGTWFLGDEVRNTSGVSYGTGKKYLRGWRRNQTGTNQAVDVGWLPQFVTGE